jgi:hypothetical protein
MSRPASHPRYLLSQQASKTPFIDRTPLKKFLSSTLLSSRKCSVYRPAALHLDIRRQIDLQLDIHQSLDRLLGMTMPTYHCTAEHSSYPTVPPSSGPTSTQQHGTYCLPEAPRRPVLRQHLSLQASHPRYLFSQQAASQPPFVDRTRARPSSPALPYH